MKIKQTLKSTGQNMNAGFLAKEYCIYNGDDLVATSMQKTSDANIHNVCWYGGERHGSVELVDGGIEGLMDLVGSVFNQGDLFK